MNNQQRQPIIQLSFFSRSSTPFDKPEQEEAFQKKLPELLNPTSVTGLNRGAAATFKALKKESYKYPDPLYTTSVVQQPEHAPSIHEQANLFAITLIRLWSKTKGHDNVIPHYKPVMYSHRRQLAILNAPSNVKPFYQCSAKNIYQCFLNHKIQNLGALTLLNLFMGSALNSESLGLVKVDGTNEWIFTQKLDLFWLDFFKKADALNWFSELPFHQKMEAFQWNNDHLDWWNDAFNQMGPHSIIPSQFFLTELFDTALRILLTPNHFLYSIATQIFAQRSAADTFIDYFFTKIEHFKNNFCSSLPLRECLKWQDYFEDNSYDELTNYLKELDTFSFCTLNDKKITQNYIGGSFKSEMLLNAMALEIPSLDNYLSDDMIQAFSDENKAICLTYILHEAELLWQNSMGKEYRNKLWDLLDCLSRVMDINSLAKIPRDIPFLFLVLMKSIQFENHNIAAFLIALEPELLNKTIEQCYNFLPEDKQWIGHSLLYLATQNNNDTLINLLLQSGAQLLESEQVSVLSYSPSQSR